MALFRVAIPAICSRIDCPEAQMSFKDRFLRGVEKAQKDRSRFGEQRRKDGDLVKAFFPEPSEEPGSSRHTPPAPAASQTGSLASKSDLKSSRG